jgi:hypothetical protein
MSNVFATLRRGMGLPEQVETAFYKGIQDDL